MRHVELTTRLKVLATVGVLAATGGIAGLATYGTFTSTTTAGDNVTAGTVVLTYANGVYTNNLNVDATNLVPGDTVKRAFNLVNTSTEGLSGVTLAVAGSGTLVTGANGLSAVLQECSSGWSEAGHVYTCSGTTTSVLASTALSALSTATALGSGLSAVGTHSLLLTMTLPALADNTYQGLTSALTFTFTGTQRAANSTN
jgi:hypothetical protein